MKTFKSIQEIDLLIARDWAKTFECKVEDFVIPGTIIQEREGLKDSGEVDIWHCGAKTILRIDPKLKDKIGQLTGQLPQGQVLTGEHLGDFYDEKELGCSNIDHLFYLYQQHFKPFALPEGYSVRRLNADDLSALEQMKSQCSADDLECSFIEIDHEIICGVFQQDQLVAAASVLDWVAFYDIGVLTAPAWRGRGVGKAAVSLLVEEIFKTEKIPLYRCNITRWGSRGIALALGFTANPRFVFKQESFCFHEQHTQNEQ